MLKLKPLVQVYKQTGGAVVKVVKIEDKNEFSVEDSISLYMLKKIESSVSLFVK